MGRGKYAGVRDIFKGGGPVGSSIWNRYVGDNSPHGPGTGGFPAQGGPSDHRKTDVAASGWNFGVTNLGGGGAVGRFGGG